MQIEALFRQGWGVAGAGGVWGGERGARSVHVLHTSNTTPQSMIPQSCGGDGRRVCVREECLGEGGGTEERQSSLKAAGFEGYKLGTGRKAHSFQAAGGVGDACASEGALGAQGAMRNRRRPRTLQWGYA